MKQELTLSLIESHYKRLHRLLFPGDGFESVAFALCRQRQVGGSYGLLVNEILSVPEGCCERTADYIRWRTDFLPGILEKAEKKGLSVLKVHSHPNGYADFSATDDISDNLFFNYIDCWASDDVPHASVIMFEDGRLIGRSFCNNGFIPISCIKVVGNDIKFWFDNDSAPPKTPDRYGVRLAQAFGNKTYQLLRKIKIGVVGCSGTGSLVIEQLARNCIGSLVIVDPDRIEEKNLNRIPQATMDDARQNRFKVEIMADHINSMEFGTSVECFPEDLFSENVIKTLSTCDILFGCMDTVDGRHTLNKLATTYLIPYFDLGVKLLADGEGGVDYVCGTVHYLKPGGSSLLSRGVYTQERLRAEALKHSDPETYYDQFKAGYIEGVDEDKPAVISINMLIASFGVNELLARIIPYRNDSNAEYAIYRFSLNDGLFVHEPDGPPCDVFKKWVGRGDTRPLLDMPALSKKD